MRLADAQINDRWYENRPSSRWLPRLDLSEVWGRREVARFLALRDLQLRYKQTLFGIGWALLQPLAGMAVLVLTLGRATHIPADGVPYALFAYTGLAIWFYVSHAVSSAAESLTADPHLVTKVWFPRVLAPVAALGSWLVDLAVSLLALAVLLAIYGVAPGLSLVLLPVWIVAAILVSLGVGLWLSALNVLYRDVRYTLGFLLQIWLLASPVLYSASAFHGTARTVLALNPLCGLLDGARWSLLNAPSPPAVDLLSVLTGFALLLTGVAWFVRTERRFADRI